MPTRPRRVRSAGRPRRYSSDRIIDALKRTKGAVYLAAEDLGCTAQTIYDRAKKDPKVAEILTHESGKVDDLAELKLYYAILAGESWAIQYRLSRRAKHRGYGEKSELELTGPDGRPIELSHATSEEIGNILKSLDEAIAAGADQTGRERAV